MVPPGELSVAMNMNVDALSQNYSFSITAPSYFIHIITKVKVKRSYRPGVAQRVGTGIALLFHDRGTRRE